MVVGVCRLSLFFPESGSLKSKRHDLHKVIGRVRAKFNVAVAEISDQETWQRSGIGIAVVGNERRHVQSMMDNVISFIEGMYVAPILDRQVEILSYGDEEPLGEIR